MCSGTEHNGGVQGSGKVYDACVVGGGLIGLATAAALAEQFAGISILVLEKEGEVATHQSGHNSGVVHSGLYYRPGSLKARLCAEGREATYRMAEEAGVAVRRSGKLVIAVDERELSRLDELERRGRANGLAGMERLGAAGLREVEPHTVGVAALHVPEAGVVDFGALARNRVVDLEARGAEIRTGEPVTAVHHGLDRVTVTTPAGEYAAKVLVNCAGLHSDEVAALAGVDPPVRIVPFRGEYYRLADEAADLVRSLVYPVPDPRFPFLGVHFTRRVDGAVEVGPNAVLAIGREHYRGARRDWAELRSLLGYTGFRRLAARHWVSGAREMYNSSSTRRYARVARRLIPEITADNLSPGGVGVRAQAVDMQGRLVDDFVIEVAGATVHVLNAPSPGATASPAIGRYVAGKVGPILEGQARA